MHDILLHFSRKQEVFVKTLINGMYLRGPQISDPITTAHIQHNDYIAIFPISGMKCCPPNFTTHQIKCKELHDAWMDIFQKHKSGDWKIAAQHRKWFKNPGNAVFQNHKGSACICRVSAGRLSFLGVKAYRKDARCRHLSPLDRRLKYKKKYQWVSHTRDCWKLLKLISCSYLHLLSFLVHNKVKTNFSRVRFF